VEINLSKENYSEYAYLNPEVVIQMEETLPSVLEKATSLIDFPTDFFQLKYETKEQKQKAIADASIRSCENQFKLYQVFCLLSEICNSEKGNK
jgi:hypothetical protein